MKNNKKSVAIIGEGETEWFYIDSLRIAMRYPFKVAPSFPQHSDMKHLNKTIEQCIQEGYDYIVCLVDMDRPLENRVEMERLKKMKKLYSHTRFQNRIMILATNPCTEFWFLMHFIKNIPHKIYKSQKEVIDELKTYLPGYEKTKKYYKANPLFDNLKEKGNLKRAVVNSEKLYESIEWDMDYKKAYSEIHKLIKLLAALNK